MYTFEEKGTIRSPQYVLHIRLCRWLTSIESIRLPEAFVQTHVVRNRGAIKQQLQQDQGPHQGALVTPTKRNGWDPSKLGIPNNGETPGNWADMRHCDGQVSTTCGAKEPPASSI